MRLSTAALLVTLALGLLVAPLAAEAQQAGKVARLGLLYGSSPAFNPESDEQPTRFELVVNLRTAKVLGLTIPPGRMR